MNTQPQPTTSHPSESWDHEYVMVSSHDIPYIVLKQIPVAQGPVTDDINPPFSQVLWETSMVIITDCAKPLVQPLLTSMVTSMVTSTLPTSPTMTTVPLVLYRVYQHRKYWTPLVKWSLKSLWNRTR